MKLKGVAKPSVYPAGRKRACNTQSTWVKILCIIIPNFAAICRNVADIWRFLFFKMAAIRHLGFVIRMFGPSTKGIRWHMSMCKIWLDSVQ